MTGDNVVNTFPEHVYHHHDPRQPEIDLEVNETTRGQTWSVSIKGCSTPEEAIDMYNQTVTGLSDLLSQAQTTETTE